MNTTTPTKCAEIATSIQVNPLTDQPSNAWFQLRDKIQQIKIDPLFLDEPISDDKVVNHF